MERKMKKSLNNLNKALNRLGEALEEGEENSLLIDGTLQRFKITIELYWKILKRLLEAEGIEVKTPRESLKAAFAAGWLEDEKAWLQMLKDRNETSHVYDEERAMQIYINIKEHYPILIKHIINWLKETNLY